MPALPPGPGRAALFDGLIQRTEARMELITMPGISPVPGDAAEFAEMFGLLAARLSSNQALDSSLAAYTTDALPADRAPVRLPAWASDGEELFGDTMITTAGTAHALDGITRMTPILDGLCFHGRG